MTLKDDWETGDVFTASDANDVAGAINAFTVNAADPQFGGLVYDGNQSTRGGTDNADTLRAAVAYAKANSRRAVYIPGNGTLSTTETIPIPTGIKIYSDGVDSLFVVCPTAGIPVFASEGWLTEFGGGINGYSGLSGMTIIPEGSDTDSHGLVVYGYRSHFHNLKILTGGGDGVLVTSYNEANTHYSGTMVENAFSYLWLLENKGYGFHQSTANNSTVTDAHVSDIFVRGVSSGSLGCIYIPYSTGWKIRGFHTYGESLGPAVRIGHMWNGTIVHDGYIEAGWVTSGLEVSNEIGGIIDNICIRMGPTGGVAVAATKIPALYTGAELAIGTIQVVNSEGNTGTAITWDTQTAYCRVANLIVSGPDSGSITLKGGYGSSYITLHAQRINELYPQIGVVSSTYGGVTLSGYRAAVTPRGSAFSGTGEKNVTIVLPYMANYGHRTMLLSIYGRTNYNGASEVRYLGHLAVTQKVAGSDAMVVYLHGTPLISSGFDVDPTVSITDNSAGVGTLTVTFTPTNAVYGTTELLGWGF